MLLKILLLVTSLSLTACLWENELPETPEYVQYGIHADVSPPGFYGVDNKTKGRDYQAFDAPSMKGGQCLTASAYKAWLAYKAELIAIASKRCK